MQANEKQTKAGKTASPCEGVRPSSARPGGRYKLRAPSMPAGDLRMRRTLLAITLASLFALPALADQAKPTPTPKELLAQSKPQEWRTPDPANLLDMKLPGGQIGRASCRERL